MIKSLIRKSLAHFGYVIRSIQDENSVTGIDMFHDISVLLRRNPEPILFDVGANIGQTIQLFTEIFKQPHIYAFEPSPTTFEILQHTYGGQRRIKLENMALGDQENTSMFHVTRDYSVNDSLLEPAWDWGDKKVPVQVKTIDIYCKKNKIDFIDFLKIDTQGYDINVLKGAEYMLKKKNIKAFCFELTFGDMYKNQLKYIDMISFAEKMGCKFLGIYDQIYWNNNIQYANVCFVSKCS